MSLFSRFFGGSDADDRGDGELAANPEIKHPLSLQVLFPRALEIDEGELMKAFRAYHSSISKARCEIDPNIRHDGNLFGMVGWGKHVIRIVGFDAPMPADAVERCVAPAHYAQDLKESARAHQAHVILYYAGYEESSLEQYVALAATVGVLSQFGAIVVLNESGQTSFPASALTRTDSGEDILELLRTLPLPILYCGFVKHEVEGVPGVWMRTYGAPLLGLPDLAVRARGHEEGQRFFDIFANVFGYLQESGARIAAGHTMQIDEEEYLRFRGASDDEEFLEDEGELLVVEVIGADEINKPKQR